MTLQDLIRRFRVLAKDTIEPCLWSAENITDWLNDAQAQACIRGRLIREDSLVSVCQISLNSLEYRYRLHPSVYELINVRLIPVSGDKPRFLRLVSREWLDAEYPDWRDSQEPAAFVIQDDTRIRVVGVFETGDLIRMECYRLPMVAMVNDDDTPEIHRSHHEHLIQWALHKAFSIPDTESVDPTRSALAEAAFTRYFGILPDSDMRRSTREDVPHHNVAILP